MLIEGQFGALLWCSNNGSIYFKLEAGSSFLSYRPRKAEVSLLKISWNSVENLKLKFYRNSEAIQPKDPAEVFLWIKRKSNEWYWMIGFGFLRIKKIDSYHFFVSSSNRYFKLKLLIDRWNLILLTRPFPIKSKYFVIWSKHFAVYQIKISSTRTVICRLVPCHPAGLEVGWLIV